MTNQQPTEEQLENLWQWCGFEWPDSIGPWNDPMDGLISSQLPQLNLHNFFKYVVPKLSYCSLETSGNPREYTGWARTTESRACFNASSYDPVLALFWAVKPVLNRISKEVLDV